MTVHRFRSRRAAFAIIAAVAAACVPADAKSPENPIIRDQFVADPSAHAFGGRIYLYATNDSGNDGKYWNGNDWRAFSSADARHWKDHGSFASVNQFAWAKGLAWAPDAASRNGTYYLIVPVDRTKIGVLKGKTPVGPWKDAIGAPLIDKMRDADAGAEPIDPAVFSDKGMTVLAFGTRVPKMVQLSDDLTRTIGPIRDLKIVGAPPSAPYGEAPWIHKRGSLYYFSYSTGWPGQIVYATSRHLFGPYTWRGVILDRMNTFTNHQSIVEFKGKWYIFYHNKSLPGGSDFRRSINVDRLYYRADRTIVPVVPSGGGALPGLPAVENPAK